MALLDVGKRHVLDEAKVLQPLFMAVKVGSVLTYEEIERAIGHSVVYGERRCVYQAMRWLPKSMRFVCLRGIGYERLMDVDMRALYLRDLGAKLSALSKNEQRKVMTMAGWE
jgi:alkylated DNA nucleotide flippase Atl1